MGKVNCQFFVGHVQISPFTVCVDVMGLNEHLDKKLWIVQTSFTRAVAFLLDIRLQVLSTPISVHVSACVMSS